MTYTDGELHPDEPCYMISVVSKMVELHPQTLRNYEGLGLVVPRRSEGNIRLYSQQDVERIRAIKRLSDELGVNPSGVGVILDMRARIERLQDEVVRMKAELNFLRSRLEESREVGSR
jgi:MerR family transcriptional regulator/heat shock protein HspR